MEPNSTEWDDDVSALQSILDNKVSKIENGCRVRIDYPTSEFGELFVDFRRPARSYPAHIPLMSLSSTKRMASYIKLSILKKMVVYAMDLRGECMLSWLYNHLQENIEDFLQNIGSLLNISAATIGVSLSSQNKSAPTAKKNNSFKPKLFRRSRELSEKLCNNWSERVKSPSYQLKVREREKLPAWESRRKIMDAIQHSQVVVISGETGSGKSTQVVQFILDHYLSSGEKDLQTVVCTQPRRISAISLAERVAFERDTTVGKEVGYSVHGEKSISKETLLEFCTTGLLLRRIQQHGLGFLSTLSCVVVDEVHERSIENDILLTLLKLVISRIPNLKVILMSATVNSDTFKYYFGNAGHLHIHGRTFPIKDYYIEDFAPKLNEDDDEEDVPRRKKKEYEIDYHLISRLVSSIDAELGSSSGSILVFLPGVSNIARCIREIKSKDGSKFEVLPLHASLNTSEQRRCFKTYTKRKIICATNIAETSITIDDVVAVIDSGRVKQIDYDVERDLVTFKETWASRAACQQRRGRAGRVKKGICYKLYTRGFEEKGMLGQTPPEVLRTALSQVCLNVVPLVKRFSSAGNSVNQGSIKKFMNSLIDPPNDATVDLALKKLIQVGALTVSEDLTGLGEYLVSNDVFLCETNIILGVITHRSKAWKAFGVWFDLWIFGTCAYYYSYSLYKVSFLRRR